ncbi:putative clathrin assembly protein [Cinnamomum micranthum f. kanehirae]|uniref:Putative clathrin assembly protein n=1 Tax=Cinnamomum micranthum f. kanehirae TaxID=337451 RepID=A0A443N9D3_9MAGN|nr:putative clathrin assembly protein [Cinnamomum micranthum f. kanehirae]
MKLWKKAAAAVKDKRSIYLAKVGRRRGFRNPDLEAAIIKATSHDNSCVDYKNAQRVFNWVRTSPNFLKPLMWALTKRVEKTRNWVVALKALMLIHGVFCTRIPSVLKIGHLPFDLSSFCDRSSSPAKSLGHSTFVRAYYAFLELHSKLLSSYYKEEEEGEIDPSMTRTIQRLHRSQALLDLLLQIKPFDERMEVGLVREALDNVIIEVFDVYNGICSRIMNVLAQVFSTGSAPEAAEVLQILHKGTSQNLQLKAYFQLCREMRVVNAAKLPAMEKVSEEDIRYLERIVKQGDSGDGGLNADEYRERGGESGKMDLKEMSGRMVTDKWVVFEEEMPRDCRGASSRVGSCEGLNGFWQLHHHTKKLSLWQGSSFNDSRMSVVL